MRNIFILILILAFSGSLQAQNKEPKWYAIDKNQMLTMGLEMTAGYIQGWREEVIYHPNALFRNFPNLNRNFWDNRISWQRGNIFDANHVGKGAVTALHLTAVVVRVGQRSKWKDKVKEYKNVISKKEIKRLKVKFIGNKILKGTANFAWNYVAYQGGFFLAYNVTHKNPISGK